MEYVFWSAVVISIGWIVSRIAAFFIDLSTKRYYDRLKAVENLNGRSN